MSELATPRFCEIFLELRPDDYVYCSMERVQYKAGASRVYLVLNVGKKILC